MWPTHHSLSSSPSTIIISPSEKVSSSALSATQLYNAFTLLGLCFGGAVLGLGSGAGTGAVACAEADKGASVLSLDWGPMGGALFTLTTLLNEPMASRVGDLTGLDAGAFGCTGTGGGGGLYENEVGITGAGGTTGAGLRGAGGIRSGADGAGGAVAAGGRRLAFGSGGGGLLGAGGGGGAGGRTYTELFCSGV